MKSLHLLITGHVQGVGYRDWLVQEASQFGLSGWLRNLKGIETVEALISGPAEIVDLCLRRCWDGSALAAVRYIAVSDASPPTAPGFVRLASIPRSA